MRPVRASFFDSFKYIFDTLIDTLFIAKTWSHASVRLIDPASDQFTVRRAGFLIPPFAHCQRQKWERGGQGGDALKSRAAS